MDLTDLIIPLQAGRKKKKKTKRLIEQIFGETKNILPDEKLHDELKSHYKHTGPVLDKALQGVKDYTDYTYDKVNRFHSGRMKVTEFGKRRAAKKETKRIDVHLDRKEAPKDFFAYTGITKSPLDVNREGTKVQVKKRRFSIGKSDHVDGHVPAYMSASIAPKVAMKASKYNQPGSKPDIHVLKMKVSQSRSIISGVL